MHQLIDGVNYIHSQNIIHRDLKASNILIAAQCEENDFVKVIDFGISGVCTTF